MTTNSPVVKKILEGTHRKIVAVNLHQQMDIVLRKILRKMFKIAVIRIQLCQNKCLNYSLESKQFKDKVNASKLRCRKEEILVT